jgi:glucose/arabinose dehydrogenase
MTFCFRFANAQVYPTDFAQVPVAIGISNPTVMEFAPDGRIFVAQQGGSLRVIKNNSLLTTPFVTLNVNASGERGLIGIALDPDFATNNYIYLYYTVPGSSIHNRVSRFTADGDVALLNSEMIVLELDPLSGATNHNGGAMHFGKDGKLYIAVGENANTAHAQNLDTYHGKLLRVNKDGSVPEGNPFTTGSEQRKRVWAYGLRNPYTFAVHPETGRILVNDVGQVTWEEINDATTGGRNFGWPATEGTFNPATFPDFTNPLYAYPHGGGDGNGCAITGGTFFSPFTSNYPSTYFGKYFFQDLCNSWINTLDLSGTNAVRASFATSLNGNGLSLTVGTDGNLYYLSRSTGALYRVIYNNTTTPFITNHPDDVVVASGQPAAFSVGVLGSAPLSYQWQKNGTNIPGATVPTFTIPVTTPADNGDYRVMVSNALGNATSNVAALSVIANVKPVAEISSPLAGSIYIAGTTINFSGSASDAEDGPLPASALSWSINFFHDTHKHDEPPINGVSSGSFLIPNEGETSDNVWYRIILTATDSQGTTGKDSVDINPSKSTFHFATNPPGLQILLDGQPLQTPASVLSVEGMLRTIGVVTPQVKDDVAHNFESWSNGGTATQTLVTPTFNISLTAQFSVVVGTETNHGSEIISVFPNPSKSDHVMVRIISTKDQPIQVRLVDLLSRNISFHQEELYTGENNFPFYFESIHTGIYSLVLELADKTISKRLVVSD